MKFTKLLDVVEASSIIMYTASFDNKFDSQIKIKDFRYWAYATTSN